MPDAIAKARNSEHRIRAVATTATVLAAVLMLAWRCGVGVGTWGDEPYGASTALRYYLGDRPLVDSWDTNFSSAMLLAPLVGLWLKHAGSTDGLLLAPRAGFFLLAILSATVTYKVLQGRAPYPVRLLASLIVLLYLPFLSPYLGYGADWQFHLLSSFAALLLIRKGTRPATWMLPGALTGLAVLGNPPTLLAAAGFVAAARMTCPSERSLKRVAWYVSGVVLVVGGLGLGVWLRAGVLVGEYLPYVLAPDDHSFAAASHLSRVWQARWLIALACGGGLGLALVSLHTMISRRWVLAIACAAGALGVSALVAGGRLPLMTAPQSAIFVSAFLALIAFGIAGDEQRSAESLVLLLPTLGAGVGWLLGSNAGVYTAILGAPALLVAALLSTDADPHEHLVPGSAGRMLALALMALLLVAGGAGMGFTPEGATPDMDTVVTTGPFAGIRGTAEEAAEQSHLVTTLRSLPPVGGRLVYIERFPLGYLITPALPGTYSTWATSASSDRLQQYIDATGNRPARIVLTRYALDLNDGQFPESVDIRGFEEDYSLIYADQNLRVFDLQTP